MMPRRGDLLVTPTVYEWSDNLCGLTLCGVLLTGVTAEASHEVSCLTDSVAGVLPGGYSLGAAKPYTEH